MSVNLSEAVLIKDGKIYGGNARQTKADGITFDNSNTDLVSENVNDAIVEVNEKTKHGLYEVWENTSYNAFAGQTISVTTDKIFDAFEYEGGDASTHIVRATNMGESTIASVLVYTVLSGNGNITQHSRVITPSKTSTGYSFTITDNTAVTRANSGTVSSTTDNSSNAIIRIFGVVHND